MIRIRDIILPLQIWVFAGLSIPLVISMFSGNKAFILALVVSILLVNMLYIALRPRPVYLGKRSIFFSFSSKQAGSASLLSWTIFSGYSIFVDRVFGVDILVIWFLVSIAAFFIPLLLMRKLFPNARRKK